MFGELKVFKQELKNTLSITCGDFVIFC